MQDEVAESAAAFPEARSEALEQWSPENTEIAIRALGRHLRDDPGSFAVHRALLAEMRDEYSTDERRRLAARLSEQWQALVCPEYLSALRGRKVAGGG